MSKKYTIIYKKKELLIFFFKELIFKQRYIKGSKVFTLFFAYHFLYKMGLLNKIYLV
jgi:hypothetical protein